MERFSIIIPTFNRRHLIDSTLDSVLCQTHRPIDLILVDNGSDDGTLEYLREWKSANEDEGLHIEVIEEKERGACNARNKGLEYVRTRFMCFFDSDDRMHPALVEEALAALQSSDSPENTVVAWKVRYFRDGRVTRFKGCREKPLLNHLYHSILSTQRYAASTELYKRAGGWNPSLPCWNDWEYGVRILLQNPHYIFIDKWMVDVYWTGESITGRQYKDRAGEWERSIDVIEQSILSSGDEYARSLLPVLSFRRAVLAGWYDFEMRMRGSKRVVNARRALLSKVSGTTLNRRQRLACHIGYYFASRKWRGMTTICAPLLK